MKRILLPILGALFIVAFGENAAAQQNCFRAVVLSSTKVEIHFQCVVLSEINLYGFAFERRNENEPAFTELPGSFCPPPRLPNPEDCVFVDSTVYPGRWFYRLVQIDLDGTRRPIDFAIEVNVGTTGVEPEAPVSFSLHQNYPNPFNPTTRIEYAIPQTSHVSLKVFDMLGREVAPLVDEVQDLGFKSVEFNASGLASGVYFYRLTAGSFVETRKLMVIR